MCWLNIRGISGPACTSSSLVTSTPCARWIRAAVTPRRTENRNASESLDHCEHTRPTSCHLGQLVVVTLNSGGASSLEVDLSLFSRVPEQSVTFWRTGG